MQPSRSELRQQLRRQRRSLSVQQRAFASRQLTRQLLQSASFQQARHIACFISNDGEIDTEPLIQAAWRKNKRIHLPVLVNDPSPRLQFRLFEADTVLQHNRFGIPEPDAGPLIEGRDLDLVFVPLVAFDMHGNRLGMGGGYYDRTFAYLRQLHHDRPRLIGLAYSFQKVEQLSAESWDVPLCAVATEQGMECFFNQNKGDDR